ncbi:hypothetical protein K491DRAFT_683094 [Lophiostoma macrostomum CBS 122681]|uniref:Uncharacterized protein n=1 Tax=Lophiostoma macrostomum CBS 122681 TaxID=1314788 RepID=A0A6A6SRH7_9PLEO|nr:hypothetical protein K491DRAFT_683094 [Lophiostoma macrostomum CBS 122681]
MPRPRMISIAGGNWENSNPANADSDPDSVMSDPDNPNDPSSSSSSGSSSANSWLTVNEYDGDEMEDAGTIADISGNSGSSSSSSDSSHDTLAGFDSELDQFILRNPKPLPGPDGRIRALRNVDSPSPPRVDQSSDYSEGYWSDTSSSSEADDGEARDPSPQPPAPHPRPLAPRVLKRADVLRSRDGRSVTLNLEPRDDWNPMEGYDLKGLEDRMGQEDFLEAVFHRVGLAVDIFRCGNNIRRNAPDSRRGLLKEYVCATKCHSVASILRSIKPPRLQRETISELAVRSFQPWGMMAEFLQEWQAVNDMLDDPDRPAEDEIPAFPTINRLYLESQRTRERLKKELEAILKYTVIDYDGNTVNMRQTVVFFERAFRIGHHFGPDEPVQVPM